MESCRVLALVGMVIPPGPTGRGLGVGNVDDLRSVASLCRACRHSTHSRCISVCGYESNVSRTLLLLEVSDVLGRARKCFANGIEEVVDLRKLIS